MAVWQLAFFRFSMVTFRGLFAKIPLNSFNMLLIHSQSHYSISVPLELVCSPSHVGMVGSSHFLLFNIHSALSLFSVAQQDAQNNHHYCQCS